MGDCRSGHCRFYRRGSRRDRSGPTALIRSVASIPQELAPGTLVTNFRFSKSMFEGENRARLKELIRGYFTLGGMQMQITVVDQRRCAPPWQNRNITPT